MDDPRLLEVKIVWEPPEPDIPHDNHGNVYLEPLHVPNDGCDWHAAEWAVWHEPWTYLAGVFARTVLQLHGAKGINRYRDDAPHGLAGVVREDLWHVGRNGQVAGCCRAGGWQLADPIHDLGWKPAAWIAFQSKRKRMAINAVRSVLDAVLTSDARDFNGAEVLQLPTQGRTA